MAGLSTRELMKAHHRALSRASTVSKRAPSTRQANQSAHARLHGLEREESTYPRIATCETGILANGCRSCTGCSLAETRPAWRSSLHPTQSYARRARTSSCSCLGLSLIRSVLIVTTTNRAPRLASAIGYLVCIEQACMHCHSSLSGRHVLLHAPPVRRKDRHNRQARRGAHRSWL